MPKILFLLLSTVLLCASAGAQTPAPSPVQESKAESAKPKRQVFRPTKDQIDQAQKILKEKGMLTGEATGKMDKETRAAIRGFQKDNGLRSTGTLNRATLEKLGIELTEKQKLIPVSPDSFVTANDKGPEKPKRVIFRATKDQIIQAQKILKEKSLYSGEESGRLNDETRAGLKKFQEANSLQITGTLNRATLEKMGIELTERQQEIGGGANK